MIQSMEQGQITNPGPPSPVSAPGKVRVRITMTVEYDDPSGSVLRWERRDQAAFAAHLIESKLGYRRVSYGEVRWGVKAEAVEQNEEQHIPEPVWDGPAGCWWEGIA